MVLGDIFKISFFKMTERLKIIPEIEVLVDGWGQYRAQ